MAISPLVLSGRAHMFQHIAVERPKNPKIFSGIGETDVFVWSTPDFIRVRIILPIIVPEAN